MTNQEILPSGDSSIEEVASGQRLIIYSILVNLGTFVLRILVGDIGALLGIVAIVLAIVGLLKLASGLGYSVGVKILLIVLAFIPLINILMLVMVNARATSALRAAGYTVGLLGARK